jgi:hypothetical protein
VRSRRGGRRRSEDEEDEEEPAKVIPLTERRRETIDLVNFIDAHGGKLGGRLIAVRWAKKKSCKSLALRGKGGPL